mgnify:CR=1 FL=1
MIRALGKQKTGEKDVGKPPQFAGLSYLSLRFKIGEPSYRPLLFEVVLQDELALLRTIETACGSSLSRAPETHPVLAASALASA